MIRLFLQICILSITLCTVISCKKENSADTSYSTRFVKYYGFGGFEKSTDLVALSSGFAIAGSIQTQDSAAQACIIITDENGNEKTFSPVKLGGLQNDIANKLVLLSNGDLLIVGTQEVNPQSTDSCDILVARVSQNGIIKWKKTFGGNKIDEGYFGIETITSSDTFLFIGGNSTSYGNGAKDLLIYKLNNQGQLIWSNPSTIGFSGNDCGYDIVESNDRLFIAGSTQSFDSDKKDYGFIVEISKENGLPLNINYNFSETPNRLIFKKIYNLFPSQNSLYLLGEIISNDNVSKIYISKVNPHNILNVFWSKILENSNSELPCEIVLTNDGISILGTRIFQNSTSLTNYIFDTNGNLLLNKVLQNTGNVIFTSSLVTSNGVNCNLGYNRISNVSQIVFSKGLYK